MFGRESKAEKLKREAKQDPLSFLSVASLSAAASEARPVAERLLYDDDLRDNLRTLIEAARKILDELSDEDPRDVVARLWDDDKLRRQVEEAVQAIQQGSKRIQGKKVKTGGGGFRKVFLVTSALVAFLMLNPRTGPQARRITKDIITTLSSSD